MSIAGSPQASSGLSRLVMSAAARVARSGMFAPSLATFIANPHRYFAWARRVSPLLRVNLWGIDGWLATGLAEADAILKDPRFVRDRRRALSPEELPVIPPDVKPAYDLVVQMLLHVDPPDHTRIRRLVTRAFSPRVVAKMRLDTQAICDELIAARAGKTEHELIADFAYPFPLRVVASLLGAPIEDYPRFRYWSLQAVKSFDLRPASQELEGWRETMPAILEFRDYIEQLIERKRREPASDLLSEMIAAEEQGDRLTRDELVATSMLLLMASHETTTHLITSGFYWLLKHPAQYARLKADPSLMETAIDEMLRYDPPGILTSRYASCDMTVAGRSIEKGDIVIVAFAGANRDPRVFRNPNRFDITRRPNPHLSFSAGAHYCLGAVLARMEAQVALRALLDRFHNPILLEEPTWRQSIAIRGYERFRLRATVS